MKIDIVTIFPEIAAGPLGVSIIGRAVEAGQVAIRCVDLRDYTTDRHRHVDDMPYGGGPGMVMKPEPFFAAVAAPIAMGLSQVTFVTGSGISSSHALFENRPSKTKGDSTNATSRPPTAAEGVSVPIPSGAL